MIDDVNIRKSGVKESKGMVIERSEILNASQYSQVVIIPIAIDIEEERKNAGVISFGWDRDIIKRRIPATRFVIPAIK
jgi:hypothetical protein